MLQTVKEYISTMLDIDFAHFYQQFVVDAQDKVISVDVKDAELRFSSLGSIKDIVSGINALTEGLNVK